MPIKSESGNITDLSFSNSYTSEENARPHFLSDALDPWKEKLKWPDPSHEFTVDFYPWKDKLKESVYDQACELMKKK